MTPKQVLYISYDGLTDPLGQSQVLPYLKGLAQHGYAFTILSFEKAHRLAEEKAVIQTLTAESGIDWVPLTFTTFPPLLSKLYDAVRMRRAAIRLHRRKKFDMVHCRSYVPADVGLYLKRRFGVKFLFDMRGFWADEKVDTGYWNQSKPLFRKIYRYYKNKEREFLQEADAIVSLTQAGKNYLLKQPGLQQLGIDVIPCCADLGHFDFHRVSPDQVQQLRKDMNLAEGNRVITYVGSYGGWYMSKEMFRFVRQLQESNPAYIFLFLTKDEHRAVMQEAVEEGLPAERIRIRSATRGELPVYLAATDIGIFFIRNTFSKTASSPTKHAELMGMGVPVICNTIGDTGHVIAETKTGLLVESFEPGTFAAAINQVPNLLTINRAFVRESAFSRFDLDTGIKRYLNIYRRLLPANQTGAAVGHA